MKKKYYEILGVSENVSADELKKQYRKLSLQFHPDRQAGKSDAEKKAAEEKFKEISEAYAVLSDPEKRQKYDQFGTADFNGEGFGFGGCGLDPMEFFRKMHGFDDYGFSEFSSFGRARNRESGPSYDQNAPEDGGDYETGLNVSFKESIFGCKKDIQLDTGKECPDCHGTGCAEGTSYRQCPDCRGSGRIVKVSQRGIVIQQVVTACKKCRGSGLVFDPCPTCHGSKRVSHNHKITVTIPPGVSDRTRLRLRGCGQCGVKGGGDGDVYVYVSVGQSSIFKRMGNDIYFTAYVPVTVAVLGGNVKIPTPYGYRDVKINPGTQAGTKIKVSGCGIRSAGNSGDMIISVIPELPDGLSPEQKKIWDSALKLDKSENYKCASAINEAATEFYN